MFVPVVLFPCYFIVVSLLRSSIVLSSLFIDG